jgi:hypothetical protein
MSNFGKFPIKVPASVSHLASVPPAAGGEELSEKFVSGNPDTPVGQKWPAPANEKSWLGRERFGYNLKLSPPQKRALTLISQLKHKTGVQEYLTLLLEQAVKEELREYVNPTIGGVYASEAAEALEYLETWGDLTIGRRLRGQREEL